MDTWMTSEWTPEWRLNGILFVWVNFIHTSFKCTFEWHLNGVWMTSEWRLDDVWMMFGWRLNARLISNLFMLNEVWMVSEWRLNGHWMTSEWYYFYKGGILTWASPYRPDCAIWRESNHANSRKSNKTAGKAHHRKTPGPATQLEGLFLGTDFPKFQENWNFFQKNIPVTFLTL